MLYTVHVRRQNVGHAISKYQALIAEISIQLDGEVARSGVPDVEGFRSRFLRPYDGTMHLTFSTSTTYFWNRWPTEEEAPPWRVRFLVEAAPTPDVVGVGLKVDGLALEKSAPDLVVLLLRNAIEFETASRRVRPPRLQEIPTANPYLEVLSRLCPWDPSRVVYHAATDTTDMTLFEIGLDGVANTSDDVWMPERLLMEHPTSLAAKRVLELRSSLKRAQQPATSR